MSLSVGESFVHVIKRKKKTFMISGLSVYLFNFIYVVLTCYYPHTLGMENGQILDAQITASSSRNETYAAKRGRLNNMPFIKRGEWRPLVDDNVKLVIITVLKKMLR